MSQSGCDETKPWVDNTILDPSEKQAKDSDTENIVKMFELKEERTDRFRIIRVNQKFTVAILEKQLQRKFSKGYIYCEIEQELESLDDTVYFKDKVMICMYKSYELIWLL